MGFGLMFLGLMFLYDFPIVLRESTGAAHLCLDLFPDIIGWIAFFFGTKSLKKHTKNIEILQKSTLFFMGFSLFLLAKDTLFFRAFYSPDGLPNTAGTLLDLCDHFFTLVFLYLLFQRTANFVRKKGEDRLANHHEMIPRIAVTEGILFLSSRVLRALPLTEELSAGAEILSRLDVLFWIFLIWFGIISLIRAMIRVTQ